MKSFNKVQILGYIGRDVEISKDERLGLLIGTFYVAVERSWKNKKTQEWERKVNWIKCKCKRQALIPRLQQTVKKGTLLYVEGVLAVVETTVFNRLKHNEMILEVKNFDRFWTPEVKNNYIDVSKVLSSDRMLNEYGDMMDVDLSKDDYEVPF